MGFYSYSQIHLRLWLESSYGFYEQLYALISGSIEFANFDKLFIIEH